VSTCNGGFAYGIEVHLYQDTVILPMACTDWIFEYDLCCRNSNVTNLVSPSTEELYLDAYLNNLNTPFNNSSQSNEYNAPLLYSSNSYLLDWSVTDLDGDSIVYEMVYPKGASGVNLSLQPGFTLNDPFMSGNFNLDPATGIAGFMLTPTQMIIDINCKISEYRKINGNYQLIGYTSRNLQYSVIPGPYNFAPSLSGINQTTDYYISVCAGDSAYFNIVAWDSTTQQVLTYEILDSIDGAYFTATSGIGFLSGIFNWYVQPADVRPQPYLFKLKVTDSACVNSSDIKTYAIYVTNCSQPDSVWPGDTDNDKSCTVWDLLPIGVGYGTSGIARNNPSSAWIPQYANDWSIQYLNGLDYKYGDCDGDGVIDSFDAKLVGINLNSVHQMQKPPSSMFRSYQGDMYFNTIDTAYYEKQYVSIPIALGRPGQLPIKANGIAFSINFDPALLNDSISFDFSKSWLLNGMNALQQNYMRLQYLDNNLGRLDVAMSRADGNNVIGGGEIGEMLIIMEENIAGSTLQLDISDICLIDSAGNFIPVNSYDYSAYIFPDSTISYIDELENRIEIYPNPAKGHIQIYNAKNTFLRVYDLFGRKSIEKKINQTYDRVALSGLSTGVYLFEFRDDENVYIKKVLVKAQ
jgi:hypothetical protein